MELLTQAVVSGLVLGSIYALVTVGMTLVFGALRTINMAQGSYVMIGGYATWIAVSHLGLNIWASVPIAMLAAAGFAILTEAIAMRPFLTRRGVDFPITAYIATLMVAMILSAAALRIFGPFEKSVPTLVKGGFNLVGGIVVTWQSVAIMGAAAICLGLLSWFLNATRYGLSVQAVAQQLDAARLGGVQVKRVYVLTLAISGAVAGLAGVLLAPLYFAAPTSGDQPILKGLIVAILAGLGSVNGTVAAALLVGAVEAFASVYLGVGWSLPILFGVIFVVLIVRPNGLFGKQQEERL